MKTPSIGSLLIPLIIILSIAILFPVMKISYKDLMPGFIPGFERPDSVYAEVVVRNGRIWTGDSYQPWANAMAIIEDTIAAVGSIQDIQSWISEDTQIISADGGMVVPGFIDSHIHLEELGTVLTSVQLRDAKSKEEFVQRIKNYTATIRPGEWILGFSWDNQNWGGELPHYDWIDEVTPDNPVWIGRIDGHMSLANSLALRLAQIDNNVRDIEGGAIDRDANGNLTGIFRDNAQSLVYPVIPELPLYERADRIKIVMDEIASHGVTSVIDVNTDFEALEVVRNRGLLKTRIYGCLPIDRWTELRAKVEREGYGDKWIKKGALKAFVDGSLGSHTAVFFDPYSDNPEEEGVFLESLDSLKIWASNADEAGLQLMIHAIGDSAVASLLDIFEAIDKENGHRDRRFKIEHAQHLRVSDIPRFNELNVIASMQPYHAIDDGRWAEKVIGPERIKTTYAFKLLIDAGATIAFGSDSPVAPVSPLQGIYAAVTRQTIDGNNPNGWIPNQKITVEEALYAYTWAGAYASFEQDRKGTLEVGKLADFVIIDRDITRISPEEIKEAKVMKTFVGGNMVYHRLLK